MVYSKNNWESIPSGWVFLLESLKVMVSSVRYVYLSFMKCATLQFYLFVVYVMYVMNFLSIVSLKRSFFSFIL